MSGGGEIFLDRSIIDEISPRPAPNAIGDIRYSTRQGSVRCGTRRNDRKARRDRNDREKRTAVLEMTRKKNPQNLRLQFVQKFCTI